MSAAKHPRTWRSKSWSAARGMALLGVYRRLYTILLSLLHPASRLDTQFSIAKVAGISIAPRRPARKTGEIIVSYLEDCLSVDCIKNVGEVEIPEHLVTSVSVPLHQATDAMDNHLGSKVHANPDLGWPEKGRGLNTNILNQTLTDELATNFANTDKPHSSLGLWHGDQTCSGKAEGAAAAHPSPYASKLTTALNK